VTFVVDKGTKMGIELRMTWREPKQGCIAMQLRKQSEVKGKERDVQSPTKHYIYQPQNAVEAKGRQKAIKLD
jgi:hypothetical protein